MDLAHVETSTPPAGPQAVPPVDPPAETQKRGRGRPPKSNGPPATADPGYTAPKYPPPPSKVLSPEQFFSYWNGIPEAERARFLVYVYRHKPVIRKPKPTHIAKYPTPVPMEHIVRRHGAGRYGLTLTDLAKSKGAEVCECRLKFDEAEYPWDQFPPDCEPSELVMDDPDNQPYIRWLKARGLLQMSPQGNDTTSAAAVQAMAHTVNKLLESVVNKKPDADASFTRLMEMFTAGNKAALDMALSQVRANSPEETLKLITTLQTAFSKEQTSLKDLVEVVRLLQPQNGTNGQTQMLMDELKELRRQNSDLMTRLLDRGKDSEESGLMKSAMGRLLERALDGALEGGAGRPAKRSMLAEVLDTAGPQITEALGTLKVFGNALGAYWGARGRGFAGPAQPSPAPHVPPAAIQAGPPPPPPVPAVQQQASATADIPTPHPEAQTEPPPGQTTEEQMREQLLQFFGEHWVTVEKYMNEGRPGQSFADYVIDGGRLQPMELYFISNMFGADKIMDAVRNEPQAWAKVQPIEPQFRQFLSEFLSWKPDWDDEEDEEEPPPPGPRIVPPPKGAA